ncbi:MAG: pyrroline-5-carboxylate reductase [Phycisphaerae bacterium]|nr:pyrroline-5-carboxylate reductase [Phycisphaerae bacterium]
MAAHELGIVGAGNMAEAIVRGVVRAEVLKAGAIMAADPAAERRRVLEGLGAACTAHNADAAACPRVLLAVKPQVLPRVLTEIAPAVRPQATVISIAAGVTTAAIDQRLGGRGRIVRVMPNTPMLVGCGASAIAAGPRATPEDLDWTQRLFAAGGITCRVDEALLDAVTAVSGSGPAYFFYLIEAMVAAGVAEGLPQDVARALASATCTGAGRMLSETGESPQVLRARVTSPGGTTQRAMESLEAAGVMDALIAAVRAAAERSRELGK